MQGPGANEAAGGTESGAHATTVAPPMVAALLGAADDERDLAWRTFVGAYGSTIGSTVRHTLSCSAIASDDARLLEAARWVLRQLRARDCHALRMYDGAGSFTAWLVRMVVHLTRAFLSTATRPYDDDRPDEQGGVAPLVPRPAPPPLAGRATRRDDFESA